MVLVTFYTGQLFLFFCTMHDAILRFRVPPMSGGTMIALFSLKVRAEWARAQWPLTWPDVWPRSTTKRSESWMLTSAARVSPPSWAARGRVSTSPAPAGLPSLWMTTWVSCPLASSFLHKVNIFLRKIACILYNERLCPITFTNICLIIEYRIIDMSQEGRGCIRLRRL